MRHVAEITLVENSTAGNPPKIFASQTVDIRHEKHPPIIGVDGHVSTAELSSKVDWRGGSTNDLVDITDVKIVGRDGVVLLEGALDRSTGMPHDFAGGASFYVLAPP